jgi:hypothetical protein
MRESESKKFELRNLCDMWVPVLKKVVVKNLSLPKKARQIFSIPQTKFFTTTALLDYKVNHLTLFELFKSFCGEILNAFTMCGTGFQYKIQFPF